jgi:hypothetical protein
MLTIPFNYVPRPYQLPILQALDSGIKRAVAVWHSRSGKEKTFINYVCKAAFQRVGTYFYMFPTYAQAKKVLWDGRDREGFPFMGHIPREIVKNKNETELRVELVNGSAIQLIGTDNIDSVLGTNPIGCVFSEYAMQDPRAWDYMRPILRENGGWAIFDYTPRGKNHGYSLYQMAKSNPEWFAEVLTIDQTKALDPSDIDKERREGMSEELIQQEYYCSFEGVQQGSVFGRQMEKAEKEGRICGVPYQPEYPVDTWWDIGTSDATAIWFTQNAGKEVHVIDYYENSGTGIGIDHYVKVLQGMDYVWGTHNGPHDIEQHHFAANGKSTREQARALGFKFEDRTLKDTGQDCINAARAFFSRCWFDAKRTERGRTALSAYHYPWLEKRYCFADEPFHDWSSHASKAYIYLSIGHKLSPIQTKEAVEIVTYSKDDNSQSWMAA